MRQTLFALALMISTASGPVLAQTATQGETQIPGTIQAIDKINRVITVNQVNFQLTASVVISDKSGRRYNFSALEKGMHVNVFIDAQERQMPRKNVKQLQIIVN